MQSADTSKRADLSERHRCDGVAHPSIFSPLQSRPRIGGDSDPGGCHNIVRRTVKNEGRDSGVTAINPRFQSRDLKSEAQGPVCRQVVVDSRAANAQGEKPTPPVIWQVSPAVAVALIAKETLLGLSVGLDEPVKVPVPMNVRIEFSYSWKVNVPDRVEVG